MLLKMWRGHSRRPAQETPAQEGVGETPEQDTLEAEEAVHREQAEEVESVFRRRAVAISRVGGPEAEEVESRSEESGCDRRGGEDDVEAKSCLGEQRQEARRHGTRA